MTKSEILSIAKPILFNTEMVKSILSGRKTATRRIKKSQRAPYNAGDILYVRETLTEWSPEHGTAPEIYYKADSPAFPPHCQKVVWRPSIHMPKDAARIFLKVKDVRAEQLRPMDLEDFEAEGICTIKGLFCATAEFADLWDSTIKKADIDKYGWEANPEVWVIEFERVEAQ